MPYWQRVTITLVAIVVASWIVVAGIESIIGVRLPGYVAGVVGGLAGVPVWEFLRRVAPKP
jgi:hypothetical protein